MQSKYEQQRERIKENIEEVCSCIDELKGKHKDNTDFYDKLNLLQNELLAKKRRFDIQKYFVVCFGAVKAGKSTLLNALTGKEVSPTGEGVETTLRCSIILRADNQHPEGITLYKAKERYKSDDSDHNQIKKDISGLFDYLQGISKWDDLNSKFSKSSPYSIGDLKQILTAPDYEKLQNFKDYCLAEIRVTVDDDSSLLVKDVAFVDMPGVDGLLAGIAANPVLKFIPEACQHLLWVHSSISALNKTTFDRLKKFYEVKDVPVYAVLNQLKAKSEWHTDKSIKEELNEQAKKAFANSPFQYNEKSSDPFVLNAAMAWDAYNFDKIKSQIKQPEFSKDELLKRSNIEALKKALCQKVTEEKDDVVFKDAFKGIRELAATISCPSEETRHKLIIYLGELKKQEKDAKDNKHEWQEIKNKIANLKKDSYSESVKDSIEKEFDKKFKRTLEEKLDAWTCYSSSDVPKTILKKEREDYIDEWKSNTQSDLKDKWKDEFDNLTDTSYGAVNDVLSRLKDDIDKKLKDCKLSLPIENVLENATLDVVACKKDLKNACKYDSISDYFNKVKTDIYDIDCHLLKKFCQSMTSRQKPRNQKDFKDHTANLHRKYKEYLKNEGIRSIKKGISDKAVDIFDNKFEKIKTELHEYADNMFNTASMNESKLYDIIKDIELLIDNIGKNIYNPCENIKSDLEIK